MGTGVTTGETLLTITRTLITNTLLNYKIRRVSVREVKENIREGGVHLVPKVMRGGEL